MGSWESVIFERRVLSWVVGLAIIGVLLWLTAVGTPYWTVQIYPVASSSIWSYSGLIRSCVLKQEVEEVEKTINNNDEQEGNTSAIYDQKLGNSSALYWECWNNFAHEDSYLSVLSRTKLALSVVAVLLSAASIVFSVYSLHEPQYVYKRLAAVLYILYSVCILIVLQLPSPDHHPSVKEVYGVSYLLGWSACIAGLASAFAFLLYSRKRKLLENEQIAELNKIHLLADHHH